MWAAVFQPQHEDRAYAFQDCVGVTTPQGVPVQVVHLPGVTVVEPVQIARESVGLDGRRDPGQGKAVSKCFRLQSLFER